MWEDGAVVYTQDVVVIGGKGILPLVAIVNDTCRGLSDATLMIARDKFRGQVPKTVISHKIAIRIAGEAKIAYLPIMTISELWFGITTKKRKAERKFICNVFEQLVSAEINDVVVAVKKLAEWEKGFVFFVGDPAAMYIKVIDIGVLEYFYANAPYPEIIEVENTFCDQFVTLVETITNSPQGHWDKTLRAKDIYDVKIQQ